MAAPPRFYLVRHAEADQDPAQDDAARPLSTSGRARFAAHARALAAELRISRIVSSPARRARETAALLAEATGAPVEEVRALAPGRSDGAQLLALGRQLGAGVALVGHNPEIAEAAALAAGREVAVKPGTVVAVEARGEAFALVWARGAPAGS